jgi:polyisoprenyl-teichoic acid--peptidoglycan teichoic acid transferase
MAHTGGSQHNYSAWDAPTLPPTLPSDAAPPPLTPEPTTPLPDPGPAFSPPRRRVRTTRRFARNVVTGRRVLLVVALLGLLIAGLLGYRLWDFGSAISTQNPVSTQTRYMTGNDRINLLVMGYGGGRHPGANLTDSMIVISVNLKDNATTMISTPRDLWVQVPPDSGNYAKLNSAYENGLTNGYNGISAGPAAGGAEAARKVSEVLGIPVQYWLTIDFNGFRTLIDALGGVDVNVPVGWSATYIRDDQVTTPLLVPITFKAGVQHMNGERALEYARERYITTPASEGSDFARSARQLVLIHAIVDRMRSPSALPGLLSAMDVLQKTMYSSLSLADLTLLMEKADINHATRIGLTNDNVLQDATTDDGQYILEPANGDWNAVHQYVADRLKS